MLIRGLGQGFGALNPKCRGGTGMATNKTLTITSTDLESMGLPGYVGNVLYWGYTGIVEKKMEATIWDSGFMGTLRKECRA